MKTWIFTLIMLLACQGLHAQEFEFYSGNSPDIDSGFKVEVALPVNLSVIVGQVQTPAAMDGKIMQVMTCGQSPYVVTMGPLTFTTLKDIDLTFDGTDYHYGITGFTHDDATPTDNDIIFLVMDDNDAASLEYSIRIGAPGNDDRGYAIIEIPPALPNEISYLVCGSTDRVSGDHDGLIFRVDVDFTSWTHNVPWVTYIGGAGGDDYAFAMAYDPAMGANTGYVTGESRSMLTNGATRDAFVAAVDLTSGAVMRQTVYAFSQDMVGRTLDYDPTSGYLVMGGQAEFAGDINGYVMNLLPLNPVLLPVGMTFVNVPGSVVDITDGVANPVLPNPGISYVGNYFDAGGVSQQIFAIHFDFTPPLPVPVFANEYGGGFDEYLYGIDWNNDRLEYITTGVTTQGGSDDVYYNTLDTQLELDACWFTFSPNYPSIGVVYNTFTVNGPLSLTDFPGPVMTPVPEPYTQVCGPVCKSGYHGQSAGDETARHNQIHLSPVPAQNTLQITFEGAWSPGFELLDVTGRKLRSYSAEAFSLELDISALKAGVYFLRRQTANGQWVQEKFLKL